MVIKKQTRSKVQDEQKFEGEELLTVHEVASRLRVDDTTVRRWIKSGALDAIALPHRGRRQGYRIKKASLDELLNGPATRKQS
jgi:excisionase family DNA binding protein